jgi:hypothetical protein
VNFAQARVVFEAQLEARHDMQPRAKEYRQGCIKILLKTWPELAEISSPGSVNRPARSGRRNL